MGAGGNRSYALDGFEPAGNVGNFGASSTRRAIRRDINRLDYVQQPWAAWPAREPAGAG